MTLTLSPDPAPMDAHYASIPEVEAAIVAEFSEFSEWDDKYDHIIALGKALPAMPSEFQIETNKVQGCQSQVWLHAAYQNGRLTLYGDSDALIVRGLVALLLRVYQGQTPKAILETAPTFMERIQLGSHLSMTRRNGLAAMMKQIKLYALAFSLAGDA